MLTSQQGEKNTLDFVYTTQRGAYKALPLPHLGASDHITVMLMPAYRPLVKVIKPIHKEIQVWPEGSSEALQDCFDTTDWNMFKQAATYNNTTDLQEYTETVTAYITKCIGHKDYHCPGQPEAVADRGGLQTSEGSERCL